MEGVAHLQAGPLADIARQLGHMFYVSKHDDLVDHCDKANYAKIML